MDVFNYLQDLAVFAAGFLTCMAFAADKAKEKPKRVWNPEELEYAFVHLRDGVADEEDERLLRDAAQWERDNRPVKKLVEADFDAEGAQHAC